MIRKCFISLLFLTCGSAFSGELVRYATLAEVASNGSNTTNFAVLVEGGTGICAGSPTNWIYFSETKAPSIASYNQSFSIALAALSTGKKVRIHNYTDNSCAGADFISISK